MIALHVVILPATAPAPGQTPLYGLEGGPGLAVTVGADFYRGDGAAYRMHRPVVLIDQRGTGRSNRLSCPALEAPEAGDRPMFPIADVIACRRNLAAGFSLAAYGTEAAARDLDAVRTALGHERIDLIALSYGTTLALRYLAMFPSRVRAAVLQGVVPADATPPSSHAIVADRVLNMLFEDCRRDPACFGEIPDPAADLTRALLRLRESRGGPSPDVFMEKIRTMLYQPVTARIVPWIVHRAAAGDLAPFRAATRSRGPSPFADGLYLTITCSESFARMNYNAAARAARATRFGDYRLRRQRAACGQWTRAAPPRDAPGPTRPSEAALLLLSGRLDPVAPPEWAGRVARGFPRARHIVLEHGAHLFDGLSGFESCLDPLIVGFLDRPDPVNIDEDCVRNMRPPPFRIADVH